MRQATSKPFGEKDIALNKPHKMKKSAFFIRVYLVLLISVITFFTLYAYRNDVLDYWVEKNRIDPSPTLQEVENIKKAFLQYDPSQGDKQAAETIIREELGSDYDFMVLIEGTWTDTQSGVEAEEYYNMYVQSYISPMSSYRAEYAYSFSLTFGNDKAGEITLYPLFGEFYAMARTVCLLLALLVGLVIAIGLYLAHRHHLGSRITQRLMKSPALKWLHHLSVKLLAVNLFAVLLAASTFFFLYENRYSFFEFVNEIGYQRQDVDAVAKQVQTMIEEKQYRFHVDESSESANAQALSKDIAALIPEDLNVYLYDENTFYYAGSYQNTETRFVRGSMYNVNIVANPCIRIYPAHLADGIGELWIIYYPLVELVLPYVIVVAMIAISLYLIISLSFTQKKVTEIRYIYDDIEVLSNGDWDHEVFQESSDEIGQLGDHLNHMRISFSENMEKEAEAKRANQELINAMSHDLRTPLTSLMGYLEILQHEKYEPEQLSEYLHKCMEKCGQLKDRADSLFNYFMVFSEEPLELQEISIFQFMEIVDNMKEELELNGFHIAMDELSQDVLVEIDRRQMERVFDNVRTNLMKYARKEGVEIKLFLDKRFTIMIKNSCKRQSEAESNCIGLKSIYKIMERHRGKMEAKKEGEEFILFLHFPISHIA